MAQSQAHALQAAVEVQPVKHTFHPRLQPAPLHSEAGKEAFQLSLQGLLATHHHILLGMWSTAGEPSKAPSTLRHRLS